MKRKIGSNERKDLKPEWREIYFFSFEKQASLAKPKTKYNDFHFGAQILLKTYNHFSFVFFLYFIAKSSFVFQNGAIQLTFWIVRFEAHTLQLKPKQ